MDRTNTKKLLPSFLNDTPLHNLVLDWMDFSQSAFVRTRKGGKAAVSNEAYAIGVGKDKNFSYGKVLSMKDEDDYTLFWILEENFKSFYDGVKFSFGGDEYEVIDVIREGLSKNINQKLPTGLILESDKHELVWRHFFKDRIPFPVGNKEELNNEAIFPKINELLANKTAYNRVIPLYFSTLFGKDKKTRVIYPKDNLFRTVDSDFVVTSYLFLQISKERQEKIAKEGYEIRQKKNDRVIAKAVIDEVVMRGDEFVLLKVKDSVGVFKEGVLDNVMDEKVLALPLRFVFNERGISFDKGDMIEVSIGNRKEKFDIKIHETFTGYKSKLLIDGESEVLLNAGLKDGDRIIFDFVNKNNPAEYVKIGENYVVSNAGVYEGEWDTKWRVNDGTDYNQGGLIPIPNDKFRSVADIDFDIMKFKSINESNDEFLRFLKENAENAKVEKFHMFVLNDNPVQLTNFYNQNYVASIGNLTCQIYKQKDNLIYVKGIDADIDFTDEDITIGDNLYKILHQFNTDIKLEKETNHFNSQDFTKKYGLMLQDSDYWQDNSYEISTNVASGLWSGKFDNSFHIAGKKKFVELFVDNEFAYFYTKNKIHDISSANNLIRQQLVGNLYNYFIFANRSAMFFNAVDKELSLDAWADKIRGGYNSTGKPENAPAAPISDSNNQSKISEDTASEYLLTTEGLTSSMGSVISYRNIVPKKYPTALTNIPNNDYLLNKSYLWLNLTLEPFLGETTYLRNYLSGFGDVADAKPLGDKITKPFKPAKINTLMQNRYRYALGADKAIATGREFNFELVFFNNAQRSIIGKPFWLFRDGRTLNVSSVGIVFGGITYGSQIKNIACFRAENNYGIDFRNIKQKPEITIYNYTQNKQITTTGDWIPHYILLGISYDDPLVNYIDAGDDLLKIKIKCFVDY